MAEWLRRVTRNHVGSARPGSSPGGVESFFDNFYLYNTKA